MQHVAVEGLDVLIAVVICFGVFTAFVLWRLIGKVGEIAESTKYLDYKLDAVNRKLEALNTEAQEIKNSLNK